MKKRIQVRSYLEEDGTQIVAIPLSNADKEVRMTIEDYRKIKAAGVTDRFYQVLNGINKTPFINAYVTKKGSVSVARLITHATREQHIHFYDNDRYNLRASNLELVNGPKCLGVCYFPSNVCFGPVSVCTEYKNGIKIYDSIMPR